MTFTRWIRYALTLAVAAALPACGTLQINGAAPQLANPLRKGGERHASWMSPDAKSQDLLYVEQGTDIYVYSYPKGTLEGEIGGLKFPVGECVDKAGDVFVADYYLEKIFEYPHGATKSSRTYDDSGFGPYDCAVSPVNGELAVANYMGRSTYNGNIAIYKPPSRKPKTYINDAKIPSMKACAYDNKGNLYVTGIGGPGRYGILRAGKHFIISLGGISALADPGAMHWDGKYLDVIGNLFKGEIVRYKISGQTGTKIGVVQLKGAKDFDAFWLQYPNVIAPETSQSILGIWKYPAGGRPVKSIETAYRPAEFVVSTVKH